MIDDISHCLLINGTYENEYDENVESNDSIFINNESNSTKDQEYPKNDNDSAIIFNNMYYIDQSDDDLGPFPFSDQQYLDFNFQESSNNQKNENIHKSKRYHVQVDGYNFYNTDAGIWMKNIFGNKIPSKSKLLCILNSLNIPWNDDHETPYLWKKVQNSNKLSYREIRRNKNVLLDYLSRVWENKRYQQYLKIALLNLKKDSK